MRHGRCAGQVMKSAMILPMLGLAGGCINVRAPDKPIEINLNIRIDANVVYQLKDDTKKLIEDNKELFPE
jgi:hypothetical protein